MAKGLIADLSHLAAANGFVQPLKRHLDRFGLFAQHICVTNTQTDTQTHRPRYLRHL